MCVFPILKKFQSSKMACINEMLLTQFVTVWHLSQSEGIIFVGYRLFLTNTQMRFHFTSMGERISTICEEQSLRSGAVVIVILFLQSDWRDFLTIKENT